MARTNIDINEELVQAAMRKYGLKTKREAVDLALRKLVGPKFTLEIFESVRGIGWEGDLDELRSSKIDDWPEVSEAPDSMAQ